MTFYTLETQFTFGKFKGKTVREVLVLHPLYLERCSLYVDQFYLSNDTIEALKQINPSFSISEVASQKLIEKYDLWEREQESDEDDSFNEDNDDNNDRYSEGDLEGNWEEDSMNPAHNPHENPWIAVFGPGDEAEMAYWNTD